jgi:hypothetical protein
MMIATRHPTGFRRGLLVGRGPDDAAARARVIEALVQLASQPARR